MFITGTIHILLLLPMFSEAGPWCFKCDAVVHPAVCKKFTVCGDYDSCSADKHTSNNGAEVFSSGCKPSANCTSPTPTPAVTRCQECCRGTLCNEVLCGASELSTNNRLWCAHCQFQADPKDCDQAELCSQDEHCVVSEQSMFGRTFYNLGCEIHTNCAGKTLAADKMQCCDSHLCNSNKAAVSPDVYTPPPAVTNTTTSATTTASGTTPTLPPVTTAATPIALSSTFHNVNEGLTVLQCSACQGGKIEWSRMEMDFNHTDSEVFRDTGHGALAVVLRSPQSLSETGVYECHVTGMPTNYTARFVIYKQIPGPIVCDTLFNFGTPTPPGVVYGTLCPASCPRSATKVAAPLEVTDKVCESAFDRQVIPPSGGWVAWLIKQHNMVALLTVTYDVVDLVT